MNIWNIAAKDLLLLVRDRRAVVVLVALPLVFIAIIGMSTGKMLGWRNRNEHLRLAIVSHASPADSETPANARPADSAADAESDANGSSVAASADRRLTLEQLAPEIIERLKQHKGMQINVVPTLEEARALLNNEKYTATVVIGPEFTQRVDDLLPGDVMDLERMNLSAIDIALEAQDPPDNAGALARAFVHFEAFGVVAPYVLHKNTAIRQAIRVSRRRTEAGQASEPAATEAEEEVSGGFGSVVYQKVVPAYTVMFAFFLVTLMSRSFLTERELGTYRRLKTTPVSSASLILGKVLPFFLISLVQAALLFVFGRLIFGMSWGAKPWLLFPVVFATSAAATGLGMLIATIVRSDAQVTSIATLVILAMAGISGCFMPRDWLPEAMQTASLATPHAWALIAYDQILNTRAPNIEQVWRCCGLLWGFAGAYFAIGWWRFRSLPV